jgi:TP901 family phage tail tape measure protein
VGISNSGVRYDLIARDSASRTFRTVGNSASTLDRTLGKLGKAALVAGAALAGGIAVGLAEGTKKATAFEASMKKIQTQAGATAGDVGILSTQVLELGKSTQQGPEKLSEALYHLKSVGMDNVDAMKALKVASDLAAVGGADLESTTNALAGAWRTGIKGAETFTKTASTVNAILGAGNMRMEDLTAAIGTGILPSAKAFGLSLNQVGAALALMTDEGIPATDAATRLRMSFSLLGAPSKAADKQLAKIGLTGLQLAHAMRGPDGIIGAVSLLKDHLDKSGMSAEQQSQILSRSFGGGRSSSGILTLLNNLDVLRKKQNQVNSSMGKYGPAVEAQRKTAAAQFALISSNFEVFSIKAGNLLLPPITEFTTYINKTGLPAVHHYTQDLAAMVPVDRIKSGFSTARGLVADFVTGLMPKDKTKTLTVPTPQIKAPVVPSMLRKPFVFKVPSPQLKSAASIPSMLRPPKPQKSDAQAFGEQLRGLISGGIGDALKNAWKGIDWKQLGKTIGTGLDTAIGWVGEHTADLTKRFIKILGQIDYVTIGKSLGKIAIPLSIGIITSLFDPLFTLDFWVKHWLDSVLAVLSVIPMGKLAGPLEKIVSKIPILKIFSPLLKGIEKVGKPIGDAAGRVAKFFGSSLWKGLASVFPEAATVLERESGLLTTRLGMWGLDLLRAGDRAIHFLGNGFKSGFGWAIAKIGEGIGRILKPFVDAGTWLVKKGGDIVVGLSRGLAAGGRAVGLYVTDHVITPLKSAFTTAGTWLYYYGAKAVDGLKSGAAAGGRAIGGWFKTNIIDRVTGAFSTATTWLYYYGSSAISGLKSGAASGASTIGRWFKSNVIDKVTGAFSKSSTWLVASGGAIVSGLVAGTWSWLAQKGHDFLSWAGKIKDKIVSAITSVFKIASPSKVMMEYGGHIIAGLQHGMLSGKNVLHAAVKNLFHSPLDAAETLLKNGVQLPAKWIGRLLSAKAPQGSDVPLNPNVAGAQNYAAGLVQQLWPKDAAAEMSALRSLWMAESGWKTTALNQASGAYGIPQALPASKMSSAGADWRTSAATQIRWGLQYILSRYGDPATAWGSWNVHRPHWYAKGGLAGFGETAWVGERGPELMQVTSKGTRILSNPDSMSLAGMVGMQIPGYASGTVSLSKAKAGVSAAQHKVNALETEIAALRRAEAKAHSSRQRKRDQLAIMAEEEKLKAARTTLTAAKKTLTAAEAQAKRVQSVANSISNGFLKTLETGTAAAIASAVKSMNTKLQAAGAGSLVAGNLKTSARLQTLATQKASITSKIAAANQYASDQSAGLGDYLSLSNIPASSLSSLISRMQSSQDTAAKFSAEVTDLRKRGLSTDILGQLADAGPGSQLAALLSKASAGDIGQLNKLAASQKKLTVSFGQTMADAMYDSGAAAGKGFLTGLQQQEKDLQAEMDRLAAGMVATIKKKLGIKSPSTVMRDQVGKQAALGAAVGVRLHAPKATAEVQRMADTMAAVRARAAAGRAGATAASGAPQVVHHHHETTYEINARTADFTMQHLEIVQRRLEARERVGRPR